MVWISDGIVPVFFEERDAVGSMLIKSEVIFSSVTVDMRMAYKIAIPIFKPLTNWVGISVYGATQYLAKQTGGEAVSVHRPDDYANGLEKIIGNLNARYNLGFALAQNETDDGTMHNLEVRVSARDAKGKMRKITVQAPRGY